jgi:hypothetical protein
MSPRTRRGPGEGGWYAGTSASRGAHRLINRAPNVSRPRSEARHEEPDSVPELRMPVRRTALPHLRYPLTTGAIGRVPRRSRRCAVVVPKPNHAADLRVRGIGWRPAGSVRPAGRSSFTEPEIRPNHPTRRREDGRAEFPAPTRFVGTVRRECLDWTLIRGRRHLAAVLDTYVEHYNSHRPHRGLALTSPNPRAQTPPTSPALERVQRRDLLGGLIHEYELAA